MWDVYLGGLSDTLWRSQLKNSISSDIKIFDPMVEGYQNFDEAQRANEMAKQLSAMQEKCALVVFYLNQEWSGHSTLLELGDSVGRGAQVMVCLDGNVKDVEKILRYCEYHGVIITYTLEQLVTAIEEYLSELALVMENDDNNVV